jgi:hypothetical protein
MSVHALLATVGTGCPAPSVTQSDISGPGTDVITENSNCIGFGIMIGCNIDYVDHQYRGNCNDSLCTSISPTGTTVTGNCDGVTRNFTQENAFNCQIKCTHVKSASTTPTPTPIASTPSAPTGIRIPTSNGLKLVVTYMILSLFVPLIYSI